MEIKMPDISPGKSRQQYKVEIDGFIRELSVSDWDTKKYGPKAVKDFTTNSKIALGEELDFLKARRIEIGSSNTGLKQTIDDVWTEVINQRKLELIDKSPDFEKWAMKKYRLSRNQLLVKTGGELVDLLKEAIAEHSGSAKKSIKASKMHALGAESWEQRLVC